MKSNRLVTLAVFDSSFDVKFCLLKEMLEEAGIDFIVGNELTRASKPMGFMPSNLEIDIKNYEENYQEATEILNSIK